MGDLPFLKRHLRSSDFACKHFFCGKEAVQGSRESGVDGHLHENFNDLVAAKPNIEASLNMDLELRRGIAERSQCGDGGDLARSQIETWARIDVAEWKLDQVAGKVGSNVG
ncbi:hypothetical protein AXW83_01640 [Bosea sp. PAMC 26642]|nr:hypothetical protein AXW83_01640 [Bosea sp. PAMC 26642]